MAHVIVLVERRVLRAGRLYVAKISTHTQNGTTVYTVAWLKSNALPGTMQQKRIRALRGRSTSLLMLLLSLSSQDPRLQAVMRILQAVNHH